MAGSIAAIVAGLFFLGGAVYFGLTPKGRRVKPFFPELGWLNWLLEPPMLLACSVFLLFFGAGALRMAMQDKDADALRDRQALMETVSYRLGHYTQLMPMGCDVVMGILAATIAEKGYQVSGKTPEGKALELLLPANTWRQRLVGGGEGSQSNSPTATPAEPEAGLKFVVDAFRARDREWREYTVIRIMGYDNPGERYAPYVADILARDISEVANRPPGHPQAGNPDYSIPCQHLPVR